MVIFIVNKRVLGQRSRVNTNFIKYIWSEVISLITCSIVVLMVKEEIALLQIRKLIENLKKYFFTA